MAEAAYLRPATNPTIQMPMRFSGITDARLLKDGLLGLVELGKSGTACTGLLAVGTFHKRRPPLPPPYVVRPRAVAAGELGCSRQEWVNASDISLPIRFNYGNLDWLPGGSRMYGFVGLTSKSGIRSGGLPLRKAWHSSLPEDGKYQTNATSS